MNSFKPKFTVTDRMTAAITRSAGKLLVAVVNFPKKQIGPLMSECLVTGYPTTKGR